MVSARLTYSHSSIIHLADDQHPFNLMFEFIQILDKEKVFSLLT